MPNKKSALALRIARAALSRDSEFKRACLRVLKGTHGRVDKFLDDLPYQLFSPRAAAVKTGKKVSRSWTIP